MTTSGMMTTRLPAADLGGQITRLPLLSVVACRVMRTVRAVRSLSLLPGAGGPGDQQVGAVQPDQPRGAVLPAADRQGPQVRRGGDREGGDDDGECVAADQLEHEPAGPGRADPAQERAEPVGEIV